MQKKRRVGAIAVMTGLLLILLGCQSTSQLTLGQKYAVYRVENIYRLYDRHFAARDEIIKIISSTDRNLNVLVDLAEYAAKRGQNTPLYVELARYAARSPVASTEFVDIARNIKPTTYWSEWEHVAEAFANADSKEEVRRLRKEYL